MHLYTVLGVRTIRGCPLLHFADVGVNSVLGSFEGRKNIGLLRRIAIGLVGWLGVRGPGGLTVQVPMNRKAPNGRVVLW